MAFFAPRPQVCWAGIDGYQYISYNLFHYSDINTLGAHLRALQA